MALTNNVMAFTAGDEKRQRGYKAFVQYMKDHDAGTVTENQHKDCLDFYKSEIALFTGKNPENFPDLATYCGLTDVREVAFAIVGMMADLVIVDALNKDYGAIAQIAHGGWGDSLKVTIKPRDLLVTSKGGRSKRTFNVQKQFAGERTVIAEMRPITVGVSLYDVLTGKYSLSEFMSRAVISMEANMRNEMYGAFATAMENLTPVAPGVDNGLKITGYTQNSAVNLAQTITAWNGGQRAVYMGTALALNNILPASTSLMIPIGSDYVNLGYLREFFGFRVMEMQQYADYTTEFKLMLRDDRIYVISPTADKMVKVFIEGSTLSNVNGGYDNANLMINGTLYKSYGIEVITSALGGMIELA